MGAEHERSAATLSAAWDRRGIDVGSLSTSSEQPRLTTFRADTVRAGGDGDVHGPAVLEGDRATTTGLFTMKQTLGEGGMGRVRAAWQTGLEREVAIKVPHADATAATMQQLLREARVTGTLEHPNIVPVHALGLDAGTRPLIVMRRIGGTVWSALLEVSEDEERMRLTYLRRHLRILIQVAGAVHFAHSRGILHRDIKPANVMVGVHKEVYVVDWGIAVRHGQTQGLDNVPHAKDVRLIEGTPAYMAPEMAEAAGDRIGCATDVYLLGATLFEVITGEPPHDGQTLAAVLQTAYCATPTLPDRIPAGLAAICRKAMALEASERYASAQEFADALEGFLVHRASAEITRRAERELATLEELAASDERHSDGELHDIYMRFAECRFGFMFALREWPANVGAQDGYDRAHHIMARVELARGAPDAALVLLREASESEPELAAQVADALAEHQQRDLRLLNLQHDVDLRVGARFRARMVLGLGWLIGAAAVFAVVYPPSLWHIFALNAACGLAVALINLRQGLPKNLVSRRLSMGMILLFVTHMVWVGIGHQLDLSVVQLMTVLGAGDIIAFGAATVFMDRSLLALAIGAGLGVGAMMLWPEHTFLLFAVQVLVSSAESSRIMAKGPAPLDYDPQAG